MKLYPYRTFEITSPLSAEAALERLRASAEPRKWLRASRDHKTFEGAIEGSEFELRRIIHYRNSFLPQIRGHVEPLRDGSRLTGTMRVHPVIVAFMVLWMAIVVFIGVPLIAGALSDHRFPPVSLVPIIMLAFGIALPTFGFRFEARKGLRELATIVDASRVEMR
jgi:hypothetical protein